MKAESGKWKVEVESESGTWEVGSEGGKWEAPPAGGTVVALFSFGVLWLGCVSLLLASFPKVVFNLCI